MAAITVTPASIRPLNGYRSRRGTAGGSGDIGDAVYLDGTNGWKQGDADAVGSAQVRGIVVAVNGTPSLTYVTGDTLDIVTSGPVTGFSGLTPGSAVFNSVTAGKMDQTAPALSGDFSFAVGWAESAITIYVQPQITVPVAI